MQYAAASVQEWSDLNLQTNDGASQIEHYDTRVYTVRSLPFSNSNPLHVPFQLVCKMKETKARGLTSPSNDAIIFTMKVFNHGMD